MDTMIDAALRECRRELVSACRLPLADDVADLFIELFRNDFTDMLTGEPEKTWVLVGSAMRDNARYIGVFAEYFSRETGQVTMKELVIALIVTKATCFVGLPEERLTNPASLDMFFGGCKRVVLNAEPVARYNAFLDSVEIRHIPPGVFKSSTSGSPFAVTIAE